MTSKDMLKPLIITGLSGAGISSVLKALEDFNFEVFDNFPVSLVPELYAQTKKDEQEGTRLAIGIDTRTRGFSPEAILEIVEKLGARLLFITCDDTVLQKRFTETRRRHPLAREKSLIQGITAEKALMLPLKKMADLVIDSSEISVHDLRHILEGHFVRNADENLIVTLMSFGFRNGVPREADLVMDVRFLKNPHWKAELRPKTGLDPDVGAYIEEDEAFQPFLRRFKALLEPLLPRYIDEGKSYLTIAIGCTGGKHRSVYTVETLKKWFEEQEIHVYADHRDLPEI